MTTAPVATKPVLRRGSTDIDVAIVQDLLKTIGLYQASVDQIFGAKTEAAVREFQQRGQLQVDGVVSAKTWKSLESLATFQTFD